MRLCNNPRCRRELKPAARYCGNCGAGVARRMSPVFALAIFFTAVFVAMLMLGLIGMRAGPDP